jgi:hypothetical protein
VITCNRQEFILLDQGILLDRTADCKVRIGDTLSAHAAHEAHDAGEVVCLERGPGLYSYMYHGVETLEKP